MGQDAIVTRLLQARVQRVRERRERRGLVYVCVCGYSGNHYSPVIATFSHKEPAD